MLTERELAVLKLRKEGKTQAEIAKLIDISQPAVSNFERNAQRKISEAKELLAILKKMGLLALAIAFFLPFLSNAANAAAPNPGHAASSVGAGTFAVGSFAFQQNLTVNGTLFFIDSANTRVGIGTLTPTATFHVNSSLAAGSLLVTNTSGSIHVLVNGTTGNVSIGTTDGSAKLQVAGGLTVTNTTGGMNFIVTTFNNGTARVGINVADPLNELSVNGTINASGTINQGAGLDIAEQFGSDGTLIAGDIVAIVDRDNVKKSTVADAFLTIGVVSTQPGFTMSKQGLTNPRFIALAGRVPVNINGPVLKGDYITTSTTPGVGTVATQPSFVVGRALEDSAGGSVYILVNPGYFSPRIDTIGNLIGGSDDRKYLPAQNEQLDGIDLGTAPAVSSFNETNITDMSISGELQTNIIKPEEGKDVVVIIG